MGPRAQLELEVGVLVPVPEALHQAVRPPRPWLAESVLRELRAEARDLGRAAREPLQLAGARDDLEERRTGDLERLEEVLVLLEHHLVEVDACTQGEAQELSVAWAQGQGSGACACHVCARAA